MKRICAVIMVIILGLVVSFAIKNRSANKEQIEEQQSWQSQEPIITHQLNDLIKLEQPLPDQRISSPVKIKGQARGNWFFEGDFPVILTDWDGKIIAQGYATAKSDWMTEEFVPFAASLEFTKPALYDRGSLILQKDNPSGLPENDQVLEITVYFE